nr:protein ULTRAPETALA 1-like [Ipomoea batatas]
MAAACGESAGGETMGAGDGEMFSAEETREIYGFKRGDGYVEMMCGITTSKFGEYGGMLRIFANGDLQITCQCFNGCTAGALTPVEFHKHSAKQDRKNWRKHIWVTIGSNKVPLSKTRLLRYYDSKMVANNGGICHRDEFRQCSLCKKTRRFNRRNKEECRAYHDALSNADWKCSDMPAAAAAGANSCDQREERACRREIYRGCWRSMVCEGCETCVCFGCEMCCFRDCNCHTCHDFYENA